MNYKFKTLEHKILCVTIVGAIISYTTIVCTAVIWCLRHIVHTDIPRATVVCGVVIYVALMLFSSIINFHSLVRLKT